MKILTVHGIVDVAEIENDLCDWYNSQPLRCPSAKERHRTAPAENAVVYNESDVEIETLSGVVQLTPANLSRFWEWRNSKKAR